MDGLKQSMTRQKALAQFKQYIHDDKGVITKQAFRTLMKGIANLCIYDFYQREQQSKKERRSKELSREEYQQMVKRHLDAQIDMVETTLKSIENSFEECYSISSEQFRAAYKAAYPDSGELLIVTIILLQNLTSVKDCGASFPDPRIYSEQLEFLIETCDMLNNSGWACVTSLIKQKKLFDLARERFGAEILLSGLLKKSPDFGGLLPGFKLLDSKIIYSENSD